jgi:predicted enzyme related to lactoylglutathione lyase
MSDTPRLVTVTMPASDASQLKDFYNAVLNLGFSRSIKDSNKSYQTWVSAGVKMNISDRYAASETTMPHFHVPNLKEYAQKVRRAGGRIYGEPINMVFAAEFLDDYRQKFEQFKFGGAAEVTQSLGTFVPCADPEGNRFGLVQLEPWAAKLFAGGEVSKLEWAEQEASKAHAKRLEAMHGV